MASDMSLETLDNTKPKRQSTITIEQRQQLWGMAFVAPWVIGFLLFTALPIAVSFYWTLKD
jgi:ABC-type sugar transport system permease subunit